MPKIVILGSCRFEPYIILAVPNKIPNAWNTDEGYEIASKIFYPAMDEADLIIVFAPDGIGEHTQKDIDYAEKKGKKIVVLTEKMLKNKTKRDVRHQRSRNKNGKWRKKRSDTGLKRNQ